MQDEAIKDRNEALLSLDKEKILAYYRKYDVPMPENEIIMWASVHKCILAIYDMPKDVKENSRAWLLRHGFQTRISADRGTEWKIQKIGAALKFRYSTLLNGDMADLYTYKDTSIVVSEEENLETGLTATVSMQPTSGNPLPEFELKIILTCMGIDPDNPIETYQVQHASGKPTYYYRQVQESWPA